LALTGLAMRTPLAASYPLIALLLFLWIAADTMMLAMIARSVGTPDRQAVFRVLAAASLTVFIASPPILRDMIWATPAIAAGMAGAVLTHLAWAFIRAGKMLRTSPAGKERWVAAASEILPPALVRLAAAELAILHMALLRWGGPADIPPGCRAFSYHKHLAPMCAAILILSAIEMAAYHLVLGHWSRIAAIVMFVLSDFGFVYLVGFVKSFRFRPILLTPEGVRVRTGFLIDRFVPFESIARVETNVAAEKVRNPETLNAALMAWPNVILQLDQPIRRRRLRKADASYTAIAFRLDEPEPFVRLVRWRLGQNPA